jgi:tyrosyl-tRNA synthetase
MESTVHRSAPATVEPDRADALLADLARTTDQVFSLEELRSALLSGRRLTIKYGVDVTAPFLHLGHAVNLRMMRRCQEDGHKVIFLIGDFTTRIGDPTGRSKTRPVLAEEQIQANAREFLRQAGHALITDDPARFECRRNGEWYDAMPAGTLLGLCSRVTQARLMGRDMFRKRQAEGQDIFMHEMLYPVLQGWDSVMLDSDLTIVGSDQLFNEMMGRFFQERAVQRPQVVMTSRITAGLDGVNKQSKSLDNYIAMEDAPRLMFGKAMSLPDSLLWDWLEVYSDLPLPEIAARRAAVEAGANPRGAKLDLAESLVRIWHSVAAGRSEREWFDATFGRRDFPTDAPVVELGGSACRVLDALARACPELSRGELRRLLAQGAVSLGGAALGDPAAPLPPLPPEGGELRVGKLRFYRLR